MKDMLIKSLLTPNEAAEYLGVSTSHLAKLRCRGDGPAYIRLGGLIRYKWYDLETYIENSRKKTKEQE